MLTAYPVSFNNWSYSNNLLSIEIRFGIYLSAIILP